MTQIHLKSIDALKSLIIERMHLVQQIALVKHRQGLPTLDQNRFDSLLQHRITRAKELGLDPDTIRNLYQHIHQLSIHLEEKEIQNTELNDETTTLPSLTKLRSKIDEIDEKILRTCTQLKNLDEIIHHVIHLKNHPLTFNY